MERCCLCGLLLLAQLARAPLPGSPPPSPFPLPFPQLTRAPSPFSLSPLHQRRHQVLATSEAMRTAIEDAKPLLAQAQDLVGAVTPLLEELRQGEH